MTEQLGDITYVYASASNGERLTIEKRGDRGSANGSEISAVIPVVNTFLFDADGIRMR